MNLDQIATKCFILALFIRDDGQRLLLGDGYYDFNQKLQHFQSNTIANDVVEIQGDNGQLLAGQVMRSGAQKFEGYIGDATTSRQLIEQKRSDFMAFFRIKHFYKVIYIFPDGTAIQRQRGYLTDAPTIPEIFQKFPEYSIALNFEDANYYEYAEDEHGDEIYAHIAELALAGEAIGGLIWDEIGAVTNGITWSGIQTAQGEYIQITNELDIPAKLASVEMLGNAEQTTYSGKNLCYKANLRDAQDIEFYFSGLRSRTFTISFTTNEALNNNSIYLRSVGSTQWHNWGIVGTVSGSADTRVSCTITLTEQIYSELQDVIKAGGVPLLMLYKSGANFQAPNDAQLELGSATAYEPYVGGTPAPNPDYPQPISVVTGESVVKVAGRNMFDYASASDTANTFVASYRIFEISGLKPGVLYTMSNMSFTAPISGTYIYFWGTPSYPGNPSALITDGGQYNNTKQYDANSEGKIYLAIYPSDTTTWNNSIRYFENAMLVEGTETPAYEPYQAQGYEVNLGKNLFDKDNMNELGGYYIGGNGAITSGAGNYLTWVELQPNTTYTLSQSVRTSQTTRVGLFSSPITTSSTGVVLGTFLSGATIEQTFTTTDTNRYLAWVYWNGSQPDSGTYTRDMCKSSVQIEKGSTATDYAPYFTPIELAKIGDYQDRIYKEDGKWYIEKQVGKKIFDGTEPWATSTYGTNSWSLSGLLFPFDTSKTQIISNIFRGVSNDDRATAGENIIYSGSTNMFYIRNTTLTTLASVQSATSGNYVYYALATPTTTEITNEALVAQLDALGASSLFVGVNNIGTETLNAVPTLKIEYYTEYTLEGAGYEWEPGGNTAKTIVTVAGVDSAWPIWTIQGGAQNPTLTNITTGQTISWQGFVPEGQTLTINMAEMTADLAGANVFEYITGEWLRLAPGNNTLVYNAGNADKPSTLSWNGVLA